MIASRPAVPPTGSGQWPPWGNSTRSADHGGMAHSRRFQPFAGPRVSRKDRPLFGGSAGHGRMAGGNRSWMVQKVKWWLWTAA